jgi:hypothetical protein
VPDPELAPELESSEVSWEEFEQGPTESGLELNLGLELEPELVESGLTPDWGA